jgi:hypothetical protein
MNLQFLNREQKEKKIEWGITPLYLMAIRGSHPEIWSQFVGLVNSIDDYSLDRILDKKAKEKDKKGG